MIRFQIPCPPNLANARIHWATRHRNSKTVRKNVWLALCAAGANGTFRKADMAANPIRRVVKFTRFWGGRSREMDFGGFVDACKPVLDALKCDDLGVGLIYDDKPKWVEEKYEQVKERNRAGQLEVLVI